VTVDSSYFIQQLANDNKVEYTFEMESIGEVALRVYVIDPSVPIPEPAPEASP